MSTNAAEPFDVAPDTARYEVCASEDAVHLSLQRGGRHVSVATDPASALLLASDIVTAVGNTSTSDDQEATEFVFDR